MEDLTELQHMEDTTELSITVKNWRWPRSFCLSLGSLSLNRKMQICILVNFVLLMVISLTVSCLASDNAPYFRFGWSETLILVSVPINTRRRYIVANLVISLVQIADVFVNEIANPILGFNIYNPDKKHINEFTKNELQLYGNLLFGINGIKGVFLVLVSITQIDIALISLFAAEFTSIVTIRMLLNGKTFGPKKVENDDEVELLQII